MEKLRQRVAEERPEDIVAMGDRAFLLHYRTDAVTQLRVAVGTSARPHLPRARRKRDAMRAHRAAHRRAAESWLPSTCSSSGAFARLLSKQAVVDRIARRRRTPHRSASLDAFVDVRAAGAAHRARHHDVISRGRRPRHRPQGRRARHGAPRRRRTAGRRRRRARRRHARRARTAAYPEQLSSGRSRRRAASSRCSRGDIDGARRHDASGALRVARSGDRGRRRR